MQRTYQKIRNRPKNLHFVERGICPIAESIMTDIVFSVHATTVGLFTADKTAVYPRKMINKHFTAKHCNYTVSHKNVTPSTCYNLDTHDPITIIFGGSVIEKIRNQTMFCFPT